MELRLSEQGFGVRLGTVGPVAALIAMVLALPTVAIAASAPDVVAYEIVDAREIPDSLTGEPGDAAAGRALYLDGKLTRCAGCHGVPDGSRADQDAGGAASLAGVADRLSEGRIRLWLVAPGVADPDTRMPGYYGLGQRDDPADPRYGEPWLTAAEIEDLVAYLMEQTGPDDAAGDDTSQPAGPDRSSR